MDEQWLVIAGWPCQDYSAAGRGKIGERANLLRSVVSIIIRSLTYWNNPSKPPAYLLENVAMQHNFSHFAHPLPGLRGLTGSPRGSGNV